MPELPDITVYLDALEKRILRQPLQKARIAHPFLLRTAETQISQAEQQTVVGLRRLGKRIAIGFDNGLWFLIHLMIAGRLHWRKQGAALRGKTDLAAFDFPTGSLVLTEAGTKKQASLHIIKGEEELKTFDPGGIDVLRADLASFTTALTRENHTLKRALTDPRLLSGIGNAYSDEILFRAQLSPAMLTQKLGREEIERLYHATQETLIAWIAKLREETGDSFPEKVTAFRDDMAVHGRYGKACPLCGSPVQRIRYATTECNYCAHCQTGGRLLADRGLSRLLREDWPRTLDELEKRHSGRSS